MCDTNRIVFLRGSKVVLRPLTPQDAPRLTRWINDPEIRMFVKAYLPLTEQEELDWVDGLSKKKSEHVVFAIDTHDGVHIGNMGLHRINWLDRVASTGSLIGEKDYWGKGYGTEAKMLLLYYAFYTLNLRKICSQAYSYNGRSIGHNKKCGYREEGVLKQHVYRDGVYCDVVQLAVFREDFEQIWNERLERQK